MKIETLLLLGVGLYLLTRPRTNADGTVTCIDPTGHPYRIPVGPCPDYTPVNYNQSPVNNPGATPGDTSGLVTCLDAYGSAYQIPVGPCPDYTPGIPNFIPPGL